MRRALVALLVTMFVPACFGPDPNVTSEGRGRPEVEVAFPQTAAAGSLQDAVFTVRNPGPGDMGRISITFARVANFFPIVDAGAGRENEAVVAVEPSPRGVDSAGVVYVFDGLDEGDERVFTFSLRIPDTSGAAANSVTVAVADDLERARGLRLETRVR